MKYFVYYQKNNNQEKDTQNIDINKMMNLQLETNVLFYNL